MKRNTETNSSRRSSKEPKWKRAREIFRNFTEEQKEAYVEKEERKKKSSR